MERIFTLSAGTPVAAAIAAVITATSSPSFAALPAAGAAVRAGAAAGAAVCTGAGIASTISGFVVGTYWFLMLIGRLAGASLGAKVSSKAMLTFTSALGLILVFLAIFSSTGTLVNLPVLQQSATGGLSFGFAEVPINAMYLVLVGLCTSIMWGGIFNLAVEGLGKYLAAASGLFMVLVCGGGILPVIQGWVADVAGFMASYWVIIAALAYLLYYGLVGCKNVNKDIPVE